MIRVRNGEIIMTTRLRTCAAFSGIAVLIWIFLIGNFNNILKSLAVIVCLPLALVAFAFIYKLICKYDDKLKKHARLFSFIALSVMFVLLLICGFMNRQKIHDSVWCGLPDFINVMVNSQSLAENDTFIWSEYFARFPNNIAIMLLYTGVGKLLVLFTGSAAFLYEVAIILNAVFITLGIWLCMRTSALLGGTKAAAICFVICFFFSPLYLVMPLAYTDVISFMFTSVVLYFLVRFIRQKKLLYLALSGGICAVGMMFKMTAGILAIAVVIILLLGKKSSLKRAGIFLLALAVLFAGLNICIDNSGLISPEQSEKYEFPMQYWIMMSLAGSGGFDAYSYDMILHTEGYEQKKEIATAEMLRRIEEKGFSGLAYHMLITKVTTMWDSGTMNLFWRLVEPQSENPINALITNETTNKIVLAASQGFYAAILLLAMICGIKHRRSKPYQVMLLTIFGVFLFFMFWEAEGRYLIQFMPIFLVLASIGIRPTYMAVINLKNKTRHRKAVK